MSYYEGINTELLSMLPKDVRTVVEIGCAAGRFAAAYKTINPDVRYLGVELFEEAAQKAENEIDSVIIGSIEDPDVFADLEDVLGESEIDVLVMGDVLEHLLDPWAVVAKLKPLMSPNGYCVACIPNISHWTILAGLLHGEWNYQDEGLLDRTHLRFFTKKTMIELFENTGWQVEALIPRIFYPQESQQAINVFTTLAQPFGLTPEQVEENLAVFQWVIRARCI
jgi:2-polyprenyl-3-methyl-5-hydroxy-6-metoxy-1,4-benzoquinol methylase